jgi:hypothetical protein
MGWVVRLTHRPLYLQEKSPQYPLDRRLGGPQSRYGRGNEEKNSQPPAGKSTEYNIQANLRRFKYIPQNVKCKVVPVLKQPTQHEELSTA